MLQKLRIVFFLNMLVVILSCSKGENNTIIEPSGFKAEKVLFIGNSHTFFNGGINTILKGFTDISNLPYSPEIKNIAVGGYTLEDHWNHQATQDMIDSKEWDVIVLQENSIRAATDVNAMFEFASKFENKASSIGAKVYFFMTWAYENQPQMTDQLDANYHQVARQLSSTVVPVGLAFKDFIATNNSIHLYASDSIHPSQAGSFLSACLFYKELYNKNPASNSYTGTINQGDADVIKAFIQNYNGN
ncbi:MAG TPA: hypothetical protein ENK46_09145 [Flavobacteriia bacterium]|nr:hypothetical protein [Flavobacteriia bacterium]